MNHRLLAALLVLLGVGVYVGSIAAPFHMDDVKWIVEDPAIHDLWRFDGHANRPVLTFSLSLDYAISGPSPAAFRLTNIAIHVCAALLLFGVVRRTLRRPQLEATAAGAADGIAFAVAALWVVHPLNTHAVTYIWQRSESLMGLFFLATVYATIRAADGGRRGLWTAAALVSFVLGLATKEVMAAVMPVLLIYDGVLLAGSFRKALRERRVIYAVFGVVALLLVAVVLPRTHTSLGKLSTWQYASSQPGVVLDYLRLAVWPHPLCFDWMRQPAEGFWSIVPATLAIGGLLGVVVAQLLRRSWRGVAGAWFFLILAPTSSVVVINDLMCEYRMYLPLIGVVVAGVAAGRALCRRLRVPPIAALTVALAVYGALTVMRNQDYMSSTSLWTSVLEAQPDNYRAHGYLVRPNLSAGDTERALHHARRAVELNPGFRTRWNLATALRQKGDLSAAIEQFWLCAKENPREARIYQQLGGIYEQLERPENAVKVYRRAAALSPNDAAAHEQLARACAAHGLHDEAEREFRAALDADAGLAPQLSELAVSIVTSRPQQPERLLGLRLAEMTVAATNRSAPRLLFNLAGIHATLGQADRARRTLDELLAMPAVFGNAELRAQVERTRAALDRR